MLSSKILLEGLESGSENDGEEGEEEEVFGLKGLSEEDSGDSKDDGEYGDGMDIADEPEPKKKKKKTEKSKSKKSSSNAPSESDSENSESEDETWGRSKAAYYSSNAAQLESDDDEANALEEQEARRLQTKARDALCEDDFGLGDPIEGHEKIDDFTEPSEHVVEPLPQDKQDLIRHLEKNSPEALALARDWDDTAWNLMTTKAKIQRLETEEPDALSLGMVHLHYQVLLTYATTLAFFLHIRSSEKYAQRPELLKSHPVFSRLLTLKQSLSTLEDLNHAVSDESDIDDNESLDFKDEEVLDREQLWRDARLNGVEADELDDLLMDAQLFQVASKPIPSANKPPKKKRKTNSSRSTDATLPVFDLIEPVYGLTKPTAPNTSNDLTSIDAYGEATSLHHADQADKNARKKSLRFHTSRIASASARRQGARSNMVGGDDDIPYKERRKEREARLARESDKNAKTRGQGGDDLDDLEPDKDTRKRRRDDDDGADVDEDADGYYELVKRKTKDKKDKKKADYEEAQAAARPDFEDVTVNGPRSLTRAILSNKGLTPHRSKSVRNPRVKKRQKFEKAKKKVSSQKAVYKGGIGDTGRYDGERSGISKVVKSIRLG